MGSVRRDLRRSALRRCSLVELDPWDEVDRDGYSIAPIPVRHGGPAYGYALVERHRPGRFDPERAAQLGVRPGPDFGRLQRGEAVDGVEPDQVLGDPRPGRKIVLSGDTAPCETLTVAAHEADLLVHEATFTEDEAERAAETKHSTARQAATIAREAGVQLLALVHLSARHMPRDVRDEARAQFARTVVPRDFDLIEVPFPERGEPTAHAWDEVAARERSSGPPADAERSPA